MERLASCSTWLVCKSSKLPWSAWITSFLVKQNIHNTSIHNAHLPSLIATAKFRWVVLTSVDLKFQAKSAAKCCVNCSAQMTHSMNFTKWISRRFSIIDKTFVTALAIQRGFFEQKQRPPCWSLCLEADTNSLCMSLWSVMLLHPFTKFLRSLQPSGHSRLTATMLQRNRESYIRTSCPSSCPAPTCLNWKTFQSLPRRCSTHWFWKDPSLKD